MIYLLYKKNINGICIKVTLNNIFKCIINMYQMTLSNICKYINNVYIKKGQFFGGKKYRICL